VIWQRNLWLLLALAVALTAWQLTRWITHVDHSPSPTLTIVFDERPPFQIERLPRGLAALQQERYRFAEAALTSEAHLVFLVTPTMRSITIEGVHPGSISCGSLSAERGGVAAFLIDPEKAVALTPISLRNGRDKVVIPIPDRLRSALVRTSVSRPGIVCKVERPLAMVPTFTERAVTVRANTGSGGAVVLDVSALQDVDDLRFSGGLQAPLGGDRTRLLYGGDDIVSAEWVDVAAQEQRDIILVIIGALSAIAAAMAIEAIRPAVERQTKRD
jgi:hypothetical protein